MLVGQDLVHDVSQCVAHGASRRVLLYHGKVAVESTGTPGVSWDLVYSFNTWVVSQQHSSQITFQTGSFWKVVCNLLHHLEGDWKVLWFPKMVLTFWSADFLVSRLFRANLVIY